MNKLFVVQKYHIDHEKNKTHSTCSVSLYVTKYLFES